MVRSILCYGDSNTWGYDPMTGDRLPFGSRWTSVLAAELGPDYLIIGEGLNGRTTVFDDPMEEGRNGVRYLVPCLNTHRPLDAVVLTLGTNDTKYRFHVHASDIAMGMRRLVRTISAGECGVGGNPPRIGIIAPVPVSERLHDGPFTGAHAIARGLSEAYRAVALESGSAFFDAQTVVPQPGHDGVHLDAAAHLALGQAIARWVTQELLLS